MHSLLKSKLSHPEQLHLLEIAESSTEMLKLKIDDILDFYELENKTFSLQKVQFDIRQQWKDLEGMFIPLMNVKKTRLMFFVSERAPKEVVHDSNRIMKILVNIIGNAVKYTKSGAIVVSIDWKEDSETRGGQIKYSVSDTGRGISKDKKSTLFKFLDPDNYRGINQDETTPLAGTGLGISQRIAEQLDTKIEFTSTLGISTTFWFTIDIKDSYVPHESSKFDELELIKEEVKNKRRDSIKSARRSGSSPKKSYSQKKCSLILSKDKYEEICQRDKETKEERMKWRLQKELHRTEYLG
jgi:signal transduction histidine kinase